MSIEVKRYKKEDQNRWNDFILKAKNSTFLFHRNYMDYHSDRFDDFSIIVEENGEIVSVLPANIKENKIYSHSGLTYGGFVFKSNSSILKNLSYLKLVLKFLNDSNVIGLVLKVLPDFYTKCSQLEIEYALFLLNAKLLRIDTALVLDFTSSLNRKMPKGRKSEITKAKRFNVKVEETDNCDYFWNSILIPNLNSRFDVMPVHTLKEITYLKEKFPKNIKQFHSLVDDEIVAGTTIYETETTVHLQYLAGNEKSKRTGALDFLFYYLINYYFDERKYFDFGIVNESDGRKVNIGMLKWKESFGSRIELHKFYEIKSHNYSNLEIDNFRTI